MSSTGAIVAGVGFTGVIVAGSDIAQGHAPGIPTLLGLTVTALGLSALAMASPGMAEMFAALIAVGALFMKGGPLLDAITKTTTTTTAKRGTTK